MKSGFIAILGKPNVGKSSLMNALVGEKVSIVSPRSQTTRDSIMGIVTTDSYQMVFVDTPGLHIPKTRLGEFMASSVRHATDGVDAIIIVIDATKPLADSDIGLIEKHLKREAPVYVVINKTDLSGFEKVYPMLSKLTYLTQAAEGRAAVKEIIPCSCRTGSNIDLLKKYIESELKDGEQYFDSDDITDKTERYMICEIIREKALLYLQDEIPHGIGVYIQTMTATEKLVNIEADIICEKDSHKSIVIGAGGEKLKTIGEKSRYDIEKLLDSKVYLKLFVKVRDNWRNKKSMMEDIGYKN